MRTESLGTAWDPCVQEHVSGGRARTGAANKALPEADPHLKETQGRLKRQEEGSRGVGVQENLPFSQGSRAHSDSAAGGSTAQEGGAKGRWSR